jgi:putative ABC transport system permease protein
MALRASLGAGRFRLIRQLLTESIILALAGAALGLLGAWWCVRALDVSTTIPIPHTTRLGIDGMVLLFTVVISVGAGILFGLAPAFQMREVRLNNELKSGALSVASGSGSSLLRNGLVAGEIALTFALAIGAALLLRSFAHLRNAEIGVNTRNLMTAALSLPETNYKDLRSRRAFFDQLLDRVRTIPGVETAALSTEIPLQGGSNGYIHVEGSNDSSLSNQLMGWNYVTADYFRTLGIPLRRGRLFTADDVTQGATAGEKLQELYKESTGKIKVPAGLILRVVISERAAHTFWRNRDAVGKKFFWNDVPVEVIGIVGDVKEYGIRANTMPQAYFPFANTLSWEGFGHLSIKTRVAPLSILPAVRAQIRTLDDSLALFRPQSMEQVIAGDAQDTQFQSLLLGTFAALALLLAGIGLYGVMSYVVAQRTREIGIRMALGAEREDVLGLVLREGGRLILAGLGIGTLLAFSLTRAISSLLFGIGALDPLTFVAVAALLATVALAAHLFPARRAMKIDPILALRYE